VGDHDTGAEESVPRSEMYLAEKERERERERERETPLGNGKVFLLCVTRD